MYIVCNIQSSAQISKTNSNNLHQEEKYLQLRKYINIQTKIKQSELFTSAKFLRLLIQEYHFFRTVFYLFMSFLKEQVISQWFLSFLFPQSYKIDKLLTKIITATRQLSNPKPENNFWLPLSQNILGNLMIRSLTWSLPATLDMRSIFSLEIRKQLILTLLVWAWWITSKDMIGNIPNILRKQSCVPSWNELIYYF